MKRLFLNHAHVDCLLGTEEGPGAWGLGRGCNLPSSTKRKEGEFYYLGDPGDQTSSEASAKEEDCLLKGFSVDYKVFYKIKSMVILHSSYPLIVLLSLACRRGCYKECNDHFDMLKMPIINMD